VAIAPRLVALRALGLGDFLTAVPALRALARAFPSHARTVAAPAPLAPLAELVGWPLEPTEELEPLPAGLRGADVLVNLHGRGPHSHHIVLDAEPRRVIWFEHAEAPESTGAPVWRAREHEVDRWCRLLNESGVPADASELAIRSPPGAAPADAIGATIVHPGAASGARRWPAARYAQVAHAETRAGRRVLITGSRAERRLAAEVAERAGLARTSVVAGSTSLIGLARLVAVAGRVVCGDTGVAHLATALGTPSVVVFGPTSPAEWGPRICADRHRILWSGRTGDPHGARPDPGLLKISVPDVLGELERVRA
jgi:ADP-heptose:LPS heptosyltransferase